MSDIPIALYAAIVQQAVGQLPWEHNLVLAHKAEPMACLEDKT